MRDIQIIDNGNVFNYRVSGAVIKDNSDGIYKWFDLTELDKVKIQPECSQQILYNLNYQSVQHIINES